MRETMFKAEIRKPKPESSSKFECRLSKTGILDPSAEDLTQNRQSATTPGEGKPGRLFFSSLSASSRLCASALRLALSTGFGLRLSLLFLLAGLSVQAQVRPYIGYAYPAGGQQGTIVRVKLGGQGLDDVDQACVTGAGVTAKVVEYDRVLGAQEMTLLNEQLRELKRSTNTAAASKPGAAGAKAAPAPEPPRAGTNDATIKLIARIEKRVAETVQRPASVSLASIAYLEVTIAPDATPGARELRLITPRGISNPLVFDVGQLPEFTRKSMITAQLQVLGKEEQALRKRPANEVEDRVTVPCTVNGQVASGELNRYRFEARKGQNLVFTTRARQLIPFIADAVPGWFQPVLVLYDADGKEVAYDDDFRFKPDPTLCYLVPKDGEYTFVIYDSIFRGREDFVYRISVGEFPFLTSIFPLGGRAGEKASIRMQGWNLAGCRVTPPAADTPAGVSSVTATDSKAVSNPLPFALDTLPEMFEQEPNDDLEDAQKVTLPIMINGRVGRPGDWDVFKFNGKSNQTVVAEVFARRLDSPLDSILKLTDAKGKLIAFNDDREDPVGGINTHHADSYLMVKLPADGAYCVHLSDTARKGGDEYGYRLRLSLPQPDFALRVVPSSASLRGKSATTLNVHLVRKDGFTGPIKLTLKDPPKGFSAQPVSLVGTQAIARLNLKTDLLTTSEPVNLTVIGTARIDDQEVAHEAVPAEDRMQAFLWRHLVPASELKVLVFDPNYQPKPRRIPPPRPASLAERGTNSAPAQASTARTNVAGATTNTVAVTTNTPPKFSKQQVAGRLRQLKLLYEEGLLTDAFYDDRVTECEAAQ